VRRRRLVANHDDNTVSWISPQSNGVVRTISVGAGPTAVACGYGSVWVTNADDRTVTRIDADSGDVTTMIRTNAVGRAITVGGGSVWVTDDMTRSVFGIDPATNTVTSTATLGAGPAGIAYGGGSLWVANALDDTVSRVDATTLAGVGTIPVEGGPAAVSFSKGTVWVGAEFGSRVVRIDPTRGLIVGSTPIGNRPTGLAPGDGGVWVAVQASGKGHRGRRLVSLDGAPSSIDPATENGLFFSLNGAASLYETLTSSRHVGGAAGTQIVPNLAAALPLPTAAGRNYTFHLRAGIRYSDGRPLRALDFRRALARALQLKHTPTIRSLFGHLAGAAGCIAHRRCDLSRSVIVQGPSTVTFRLPASDPRFLSKLASVVPVPPGTPAHDVGTRPVPSTGPYEIQTYVRGRLIVLVRNPYFHVWSPAARPDGYPDEIVYRGNGIEHRTKSQDAAVRDVLAGRADLVTEWKETPRFQDFAARRPLQVHPVAEQATEFVFLNVRRAPFDDVLRSPDGARLPAVLPVHARPERERRMESSGPGENEGPDRRVRNARPNGRRLVYPPLPEGVAVPRRAASAARLPRAAARRARLGQVRHHPSRGRQAPRPVSSCGSRPGGSPRTCSARPDATSGPTGRGSANRASMRGSLGSRKRSQPIRPPPKAARRRSIARSPTGLRGCRS